MATRLVNGIKHTVCEKGENGKCLACGRDVIFEDMVCQINFSTSKNRVTCSKRRNTTDKPAWVSNRKLIRDTMYLIDKLPQDIDAIVAVPRSGMMPAAFLSTTLHLPLFSLNKEGGFDLCNSHGRSTRFNTEFKHVLIVDDTVCQGGTMRSVDKMMKGKGINYTTACIYMSPLHDKNVGIYSKELPDPHILEWNLFNCPLTRATAFDIDGILCPDVPSHLDDDGEKYIKCLSEMPVRYPVRRFPAAAFVTARLEKYRDVTETWLKSKGILYKKLYMGPWKDQKERAVDGAVAEWKADVYRNESGIWLFVESNDCLAGNIARLSNKNVVCPQTERMY